jgi:hypothetical protein
MERLLHRLCDPFRKLRLRAQRWSPRWSRNQEIPWRHPSNLGLWRTLWTLFRAATVLTTSKRSWRLWPHARRWPAGMENLV